MSSKTLSSRLQIKRETSANWQKAVNFVPLEGELILYTDVNKLKIGDGVKTVNELSFIDQSIWDTLNNSVLDLEGNSFEYNSIEAAPMTLYTNVTNSAEPVQSIAIFNNTIEDQDVVPYTRSLEDKDTATNLLGGNVLKELLRGIGNATIDEEAKTATLKGTYCRYPASLSDTADDTGRYGVSFKNRVLFNKFKPDTAYTFLFKLQANPINAENVTANYYNIAVRYADGTISHPVVARFNEPIYECFTTNGTTVEALELSYDIDEVIFFYDECLMFEGNRFYYEFDKNEIYNSEGKFRWPCKGTAAATFFENTTMVDLVPMRDAMLATHMIDKALYNGTYDWTNKVALHKQEDGSVISYAFDHAGQAIAQIGHNKIVTNNLQNKNILDNVISILKRTTTVNVDPSLSKTGDAADAKTVGDRFERTSQGLCTEFTFTKPGWKRIATLMRATSGTIDLFCSGGTIQTLVLGYTGYTDRYAPEQSDLRGKPSIWQMSNQRWGKNLEAAGANKTYYIDKVRMVCPLNQKDPNADSKNTAHKQQLVYSIDVHVVRADGTTDPGASGSIEANIAGHTVNTGVESYNKVVPTEFEDGTPIAYNNSKGQAYEFELSEFSGIKVDDPSRFKDLFAEKLSTNEFEVDNLITNNNYKLTNFALNALNVDTYKYLKNNQVREINLNGDNNVPVFIPQYTNLFRQFKTTQSSTTSKNVRVRWGQKVGVYSLEDKDSGSKSFSVSGSTYATIYTASANLAPIILKAGIEYVCRDCRIQLVSLEDFLNQTNLPAINSGINCISSGAPKTVIIPAEDYDRVVYRMQIFIHGVDYNKRVCYPQLAPASIGVDETIPYENIEVEDLDSFDIVVSHNACYTKDLLSIDFDIDHLIGFVPWNDNVVKYPNIYFNCFGTIPKEFNINTTLTLENWKSTFINDPTDTIRYFELPVSGIYGFDQPFIGIDYTGVSDLGVRDAYSTIFSGFKPYFDVKNGSIIFYMDGKTYERNQGWPIPLQIKVVR